MNFSLEIGPHTDIDTLPAIKDVYITLLPGGDYTDTAKKAGDLAKKGFKVYLGRKKEIWKLFNLHKDNFAYLDKGFHENISEDIKKISIDLLMK